MALPITLKPVQSTMVSAVGYLREQQTLLLQFAGTKSVYAYFGVPESHYLAIRQSASVGRYINQHILRRYPAARLTEGEKAGAN